jgi:hypothetical protein
VPGPLVAPAQQAPLQAAPVDEHGTPVDDSTPASTTP